MKRVFADTFFFFAFLNAADEAHEQAEAHFDALNGEIITSEWILMELGDGLASRDDREIFVRFYETLRAEPSVKIVPASAELFRAAFQLYQSRRDKEWSLTDCTSFVIMQNERVTEALTGDHHFQQAGFEILFEH